MRLMIVAAIVYGFAAPVQAEPMSGSLVGQVDGDPLRYECSPPAGDGSISCDFVQVLLHHKSSEKELQENLQNLDTLMAELAADRDGLCNSLPLFADKLDKLKRGETIDGAEKLGPKDIEAIEGYVGTVGSYCTSPTKQTTEALVRFIHDRSMQTCTAFINTYTQRFIKVAEQTWVAESSPTGPCGFVNGSRFKQEDASNGILWEYISQRFTTNKAGTTDTGLACSGFEDGETLYTWKSPPQRIDCVYID